MQAAAGKADEPDEATREAAFGESLVRNWYTIRCLIHSDLESIFNRFYTEHCAYIILHIKGNLG